MLIETTAASAAAFLVGVITGTIQGLGKELGKTLVEKVKDRMSGSALIQLKLLEESPDNPEYTQIAECEVIKILESDEKLKAEVARAVLEYSQHNNINLGEVDTAVINSLVQDNKIEGDLIIGKKL
jgi:hypothetical protein